ncbi:MAG: histidinol-phosphate transaminase [Xanthomonadales bacterium]|nr:histidinol-phosphate transaminase [Xanthomonadales bacterium]
MNRFEDRAVPAVRTLRAYDPGHDLVALRRAAHARGLVELGSNENAYGCSPAVRRAVESCLNDLYRYPDPLGGDLKRALAARLGVQVGQLLLGNGSHEILMQCAQVFAGPGDEVLMAQYGFAVYAIAAQCSGARLVMAPALPADAAMPLGHDLDALLQRVGPATKLVYLANPNNPTGTAFSRDDLAGWLSACPAHVIVVVDEAYHEYRHEAGSAVDLLEAHPNLIVTRTFSKAHGLAALRVGYAAAHAEVIALMERVRESFNVNMLGLAAAEAALSDDNHVASVRARNAAERSRLAAALRDLGYDSLPSHTNFLLVHVGAHCETVERQLLAAGVVPRPMGGYGLAEYLRITVATAAENERLIEALTEISA